MNPTGLRFLRPYLHSEVSVSCRSAYIRFYNITTQRLFGGGKNHGDTGSIDVKVPFQVQQRVQDLNKVGALNWPRIGPSSSKSTTIEKFNEEFLYIKPGEEVKEAVRTLRGRVRNIRSLGKGLTFVDIEHEGHYIQITINHTVLNGFSGISTNQIHAFARSIRRGDIIECTGNPYLSKKSVLRSLIAYELPKLLSPSLNSLPHVIDNPEIRIRNRHVDFLINNEAAHIFRARSRIIQYLRDFLRKGQFMEVQTPILADKAGGAVAKPFTTHATEFPQKQLALRIAPELWLKRLIIGGMDRVFEIGPSFRNEGLDATHNPEFTTCEFYKSFADLEDLMKMTEDMFAGFSTLIKELRVWPLQTLPEPSEDLSTAPFKRISFIPAIEEGLKQKLPNLQADDADEQLIALFNTHEIPLPTSPTLPRLLDRLSSLYIEPQCESPTFITYHPACMAPLAKSFLDTTTQQHVSARAELFIQNREIANMYEEENSPLEQRKKFVEQIKWKDDENSAQVDESYIEALEWGMPPTGGWGMGIDRLVMLFTGAKRISDVLAFGSLRNVVNLGVLSSEKLKVGERKEPVGGVAKEDDGTINQAM